MPGRSACSGGRGRGAGRARPADRADRRHLDLPHGAVGRAAAGARRVGALSRRRAARPVAGGRRPVGLRRAARPHRGAACGRRPRSSGNPHAALVARIAELRAAEGDAFARGLHVLPDFHGNRSPLADPHAIGVISGLTLDGSLDAWAGSTSAPRRHRARHPPHPGRARRQGLAHRHAARRRRPHQEPAADGALRRRHRLPGGRAGGGRGAAGRRHDRRGGGRPATVAGAGRRRHEPRRRIAGARPGASAPASTATTASSC